jgi:hypothetical protein
MITTELDAMGNSSTVVVRTFDFNGVPDDRPFQIVLRPAN